RSRSASPWRTRSPCLWPCSKVPSGYTSCRASRPGTPSGRARSARSWSSFISLQQIEHRVEEHPDDVDEVPVEAAHLDGCVVGGTEARRVAPEPQHDGDADAQVNRVQPGHREVQEVELELRPRGFRHLARLHPVLGAFDAEEDEAEERRQAEPASRGSAFLRGVYRE